LFQFLATYARLSCILSFRVHVKLRYRIVSSVGMCLSRSWQCRTRRVTWTLCREMTRQMQASTAFTWRLRDSLITARLCAPSNRYSHRRQTRLSFSPGNSTSSYSTWALAVSLNCTLLLEQREEINILSRPIEGLTVAFNPLTPTVAVWIQP